MRYGVKRKAATTVKEGLGASHNRMLEQVVNEQTECDSVTGLRNPRYKGPVKESAIAPPTGVGGFDFYGNFLFVCYRFGAQRGIWGGSA